MRFRRPDQVVDQLQNILLAVSHINQYLEGHDKSSFLSNNLIQDAVIRNLEVIGEGLHKIEVDSPEFRAAHMDLPWDEAYGMRNLLIHGYFDVQPEIVWSTVTESLPALRKQLVEILGSATEPG
jgi:uncharacterized protein with HEPN domain